MCLVTCLVLLYTVKIKNQVLLRIKFFRGRVDVETRLGNRTFRQEFLQFFYGIAAGAVHQYQAFNSALAEKIGGLLQPLCIGGAQMQAADYCVDFYIGAALLTI